MEIPKYSEWVQKISGKPEIEIDAESFKALFNKRDERTPNKQMHNFLKAYAFAVHNSRKDDRFPNLDEIEKAFTDVGAPIEGQIIYNLKKRFMENTQFFDEIDFGTKGVYLLPKAFRLKDGGGKYSNLIFDFDNGVVTLPELKTKPDVQKDAGDIISGEKRIGYTIDLEKPPIPEIRFKKIPVKPIFIFSLIAIFLIVFAFLLFAPSDKNKLKNAIYSINNANDEEGDFIMFNLSNPDGIKINSSIILPTQAYKSFSAEDGTFSSLSYPDYTIVRWRTDKDSTVKIHVVSTDSIQVTLTHYYNVTQNVIVFGVNNFTQTKTNEKIQWNFVVNRSPS